MSDTATQTTPTADQGTGAGTPAPTGGNGATPTTGKPDEPLGPEGMSALTKERDANAQLRAELARAHKERDDLKSKHQTAEEKALEEAEKRGQEKAALEANRRVVRSEARVAATGKVADIDDAITLLGDLDQFIGKDGEVNEKAISKAIEDLVKRKPYLAAPGGKATPLPGGSATQTSGTTMNDAIRDAARGRR